MRARARVCVNLLCVSQRCANALDGRSHSGESHWHIMFKHSTLNRLQYRFRPCPWRLSVRRAGRGFQAHRNHFVVNSRRWCFSPSVWGRRGTFSSCCYPRTGLNSGKQTTASKLFLVWFRVMKVTSVVMIYGTGWCRYVNSSDFHTKRTECFLFEILR